MRNPLVGCSSCWSTISWESVSSSSSVHLGRSADGPGVDTVQSILKLAVNGHVCTTHVVGLLEVEHEGLKCSAADNLVWISDSLVVDVFVSGIAGTAFSVDDELISECSSLRQQSVEGVSSSSVCISGIGSSSESDTHVFHVNFFVGLNIVAELQESIVNSLVVALQ